MPPCEITTPRICLRRWTHADFEPFAAMNADPRVMEFFPSVMSREESAASFDRIQKHFDDHGFSLWVADVAGQFAGMVGLLRPRFEAAFTPCVEIGYRLQPEFWGQGLATEASRSVLRFAFEHVGLDEIMAFTAFNNVRSRRVMEKLGLEYSQDFEHPFFETDNPLRRHVAYRISRGKWLALDARH